MHTPPHKFEAWERTGPTLPARSLLYRLAPCGIGTPYVESLSSYITRLADAHVVSVWRLIRHVLSPLNHRRLSRATKCYAYPANGLGKNSQVLLETLQAATCRRDLHLLTLCSLQGIVSQPMVFRSLEAWCPACLEEWRTSGSPIYSPLLWALRLVTVCPVHLCPLDDRCPRCRSPFSPLRAKARPGYCSNCFEWLGGSAWRPPAQELQEADRYARWAATSTAELLAALPSLQPHLLPAALEANLLSCLTRTPGATQESFSALAGAHPTSLGAWLSGRVKPSLDQLCRLCYQLQLPPVLLFQGVPADWQGPRGSPREPDATPKNGWGEPQGTRDELRRTLAAALHESPPPSLAELARRLKYRSPETLRGREPDLSKAIADRRRRVGIPACSGKQFYPKAATTRLQDALRRQLAQDSPPSLHRIASHLGYKSSTSIRDRCPDICREIVQKRRASFQRQREEMRHAIESARTENPPPPLKQIAHRLGFTAEGVLVRAYPDICGAYLSYRKTCLAQKRDRLRLAIRQWLASEPAPTRTSLCLHFGISHAYFELRFPQENQEAVKRSAERARTARENSHLALRKEVREIVYQLREKGLYPSLPRVRAGLSRGLRRNDPRLRAAIDGAISEVGSVMRARNELGRFV